MKGAPTINEGSKDLVHLMNEKLDKAHQTADELHKVFEKYGHDYDRDKAYAEDIEAQNNQVKQASKAPVRTVQAQKREVEHESTGQRTAKIDPAVIVGGVTRDLSKSNRSG